LEKPLTARSFHLNGFLRPAILLRQPMGKQFDRFVKE
jgi:hypothetical protein